MRQSVNKSGIISRTREMPKMQGDWGMLPGFDLTIENIELANVVISAAAKHSRSTIKDVLTMIFSESPEFVSSFRDSLHRQGCGLPVAPRSPSFLPDLSPIQFLAPEAS